MDLLLIIWEIEWRARRNDSSTQIRMRGAESIVMRVLDKQISFPRLITAISEKKKQLSRIAFSRASFWVIRCRVWSPMNRVSDDGWTNKSDEEFALLCGLGRRWSALIRSLLRLSYAQSRLGALLRFGVDVERVLRTFLLSFAPFSAW